MRTYKPNPKARVATPGGDWRPIPSCPQYFASASGEIWSWWSQRVLAESPMKDGYLKVSPHGKTRAVHQLVAEAFHGERPEGMEVRHLNGVNTDNRAENLAWGTKTENSRDTVVHGTNANVNKTQCPQGHPYDDANTLWRADRPGGRECRACGRAARARYKKKQEENGGDRPHGTYVKYIVEKCRCEDCRSAQSKYVREYKARKAARRA